MSDAPPASAPSGPYVRIKDLSGGNGDEPVEEIRGFPDIAEAATFARRYVRDSIERCRTKGADTDAVLAAWFAFGEDAEAVEPGGEGWTSAAEIRAFAASAPRTRAERDWRALDPRRRGEDEGGEEEA
ncbi:hypothetical protein [Muricoccus radiodurans]|uniref:hypothetical protein n=1 Tax=Muricoccus radiodurans TaxID=2231721 RepID=UPI003CF41B1A